MTVPVGLVKSFGRLGPQYEVVGYAGRSSKGDELVQVRVLRSGEVTEYEYSAMLADPEVP
ncbi:MAG TPA: DUF5397 family protein [Granulicella sp.]|nr:DUF5397 family protein [Granulicella sp.]